MPAIGSKKQTTINDRAAETPGRFRATLLVVLGIAAVCLAWRTGWLSALWTVYWDGPASGPSNVDKLNKTVQTLAIVVGGVSAYLRFFYGQTLFQRLNPAIESELKNINDVRFLVLHARATNVGNAVIRLKKNASKVTLILGEKEFVSAQPKSVYWQDENWRVFDAFETVDCIRSGETITDEHLIELPPGEFRAVKIWLRVCSEPNLFSRLVIQWDCLSIVILEEAIETGSSLRS